MANLDELVPANKALEIVLTGASPQRIVNLPLMDAANLVLAEDLKSLRTQPPFDASAMDGYAVHSKSLESIPVALIKVGESKAGTPFSGTVKEGEAVRIFTGAVVPDGADTIIIQENTESSSDEVTILQGNPAGKFIRKAGLDFQEGEVLLKKGDRLTPFRLGLAASMNHAKVKVYDRPHLALVATGDELVMPGNATNPGQIIASNTFGIHAAALTSGASVTDHGIARDSNSDLASKLQKAIDNKADIIVTTGGASVGDHDLVMPVAKSLGFEFEIEKIKMRPGKPFLFAKLKKDGLTTRLIGLAGNPVSSLIAFNVFAKPLIAKLASLPENHSHPIAAILASDLPENDERMEYMRAELHIGEDGTKHVTAFTKQDSSMLANLVRADCLIVRPSNAKASHKGEACKIIILD